MKQFDSLSFTAIQKSNGLDIHECHAVEIQREPRLIASYLRSQFIQIL